MAATPLLSVPVTQRKPPRWPLLLVLVASLIGSGLIGFAVGSVRPQPTATFVVGSPNSVTVARFGPAPKGPTASASYTPDAVVTVSVQEEVTKLVADANNLPLVPSGAYSCPFGDGSYYRVRFSYRNGDRTTLSVERQACRLVGFDDGSGDGRAWSLTDPRFLEDLDALFR